MIWVPREGLDGYADWVDAWSEDYGLMPRIDACLLGGGCTQATSRIGPPSGMSRTSPPGWPAGRRRRPELEWARFAAQIPHYVLSTP